MRSTQMASRLRISSRNPRLSQGKLADQLRAFLTEGISNAYALSATIDLLAQLRMRVPAAKQHIDQSMASNIRATAEMLERAWTTSEAATWT